MLYTLAVKCFENANLRDGLEVWKIEDSQVGAEGANFVQHSIGSTITRG